MASRSPRRSPAGAAARAGLLAALLAGGAARADVIEIGDDGSARVREGGAAVQWVELDASGDATVEDAPAVPAAAVTEIAAPDVPAAYAPGLRDAADRNHVSPALLAALIGQESGWRPAAHSAKGAIGLAQLMPATARGLAVDPADPAANLQGGARYLRAMLDRFNGDVERALAAYNAGPGRVARAGGVPALAETRSYVAAILARLSPAPKLLAQDLIR